jgi:hypothetical protein
LTLKSKILSIRRNPFVIKDLIQGKSMTEIKTHVKKADENRAARSAKKDALIFIADLKHKLPYSIDPNDNPEGRF